MELLLDTHSFLWFTRGDEQLSKSAREHIANIDNTVFLSIASVWEMGIKHSLGKLALKKPFSEIHRDWEANAIELLTISYPHIQVMHGLPFHHRDPFDRILISQALYHNLPIISKDKAFDNYKGLIRLW